MPDLSKVPTPEYSPLQPYHWEYDNMPIKTLALRDELINAELENNSKILRLGAGTQGNMSNRIDQSIDQDGNLKSSSVDESMHSIGSHSDGSLSVGDAELDYINMTLGYNSVANPVSFVRMLDAERSKLAMIADEATSISFEVYTASNIVSFNEGSLSFQPSDTIAWDITAPASPSAPYVIKPVLGISSTFAHGHYYGVEPITSDYKNYTVTMMSTPYMENSLRVHINGMRIDKTSSIYAPGSNPGVDWTLNSYSEDFENGAFSLENEITPSDTIRIDFDVSLA